MTVPEVSFVIPTSARPSQLEGTLSGLSALDYPSNLYEVIVVNDGRDADTEELVARFRSGPVVIRYAFQDKRGAGAARNQGARLARGALLIFCDDDIEVEPMHIHQHIQTHEAHGKCLVNGREEWSAATMAILKASAFGRYRIVLKERFRWPETEAPTGKPFEEPEALVACNLSMPQEVFARLGGFDEQFIHGGAEDRDLGLRATAAGYALVRNDTIKIWHHDPVDSLGHAGKREERYARGIVMLARKFPAVYEGSQMLIENGPISRADPPRLALKKAIKFVLSRDASMNAAHRLLMGLERRGVGERFLDRAYASMLGLYMFRGVRGEWHSDHSVPPSS